MASTGASSERIFHDPPFVQRLFGSTRWAWIWLPVRLYVGYQWLTAGWHKVNDAAWMSGESLKGFWTHAIALPETGKPPITYDWYRSFIEALLNGGHNTWFGQLVAFGELLVGIALVVGLLTGIAAFFGAVMNFNFMLAGSASTNPVLFLLAILLMLAWKVAGWWGLDRWVLPMLGTPWEPGEVFEPSPAATPG
jgi:thiosulfate dehydrogenase [quinone] large subunit